MHRVFLHLLFLSVVFFESCIGRLCIFVFFVSSFVGRAQRLPARCIGCLCMCCFLVIFCLLLVFFLRDVLGSNVAVRGGNLLKKRLEGVWGGGRSASPPDAWGVFACVVFFLSFLSSSSCVFSS